VSGSAVKRSRAAQVQVQNVLLDENHPVL
jgi:hypothetical protein